MRNKWISNKPYIELSVHLCRAHYRILTPPWGRYCYPRFTGKGITNQLINGEARSHNQAAGPQGPAGTHILTVAILLLSKALCMALANADRFASLGDDVLCQNRVLTEQKILHASWIERKLLRSPGPVLWLECLNMISRANGYLSKISPGSDHHNLPGKPNLVFFQLEQFLFRFSLAFYLGRRARTYAQSLPPQPTPTLLPTLFYIWRYFWHTP